MARDIRQIFAELQLDAENDGIANCQHPERPQEHHCHVDWSGLFGLLVALFGPRPGRNVGKFYGESRPYV